MPTDVPMLDRYVMVTNHTARNAGNLAIIAYARSMADHRGQSADYPESGTAPQFFRTGLPDLGSTVVSDLVSFEPVADRVLHLVHGKLVSDAVWREQHAHLVGD